MKLEKMKRCQKAQYGFKGVMTGENLFTTVSSLTNIIGAEGQMVDTKKWPGVKQPAWFLQLQPSQGWGSSSGGGAVNFTLYVNDEDIACLLTVVSE
jgi:hypothetical protein